MASNVKKELSDALLRLCETKKLSRITIQDIIEEADMGRQTFYNHFRNKNGLINWTWEEHLVGAGLMDQGEIYDYVLQISMLHAKHRKFFLQASALMGQNSLVDYMIQHNRRNYTALALAVLNDETGSGTAVLPPEIVFAINFNAYGATHMHIKWVRENMPTSPEVFSRRLVDSIPKELKVCLAIE